MAISGSRVLFGRRHRWKIKKLITSRLAWSSKVMNINFINYPKDEFQAKVHCGGLRKSIGVGETKVPGRFERLAFGLCFMFELLLSGIDGSRWSSTSPLLYRLQVLFNHAHVAHQFYLSKDGSRFLSHTPVDILGIVSRHGTNTTETIVGEGR